MISLAEFLHKYLVLILWILWIGFGALYYTLHDDYDYYIALYKSVSIGWSIGWDLPYDTDFSEKPASMTYSCFHNCMGVMFTGMVVIMIAEKVVADTDDWMVEITNKRTLLNKMKRNPGLKSKIITFINLNKTTVELIVVCILFGFCGVMLGVSLGKNTWTIAKSMDLTLSTLCTCGYLGLPFGALPWKYVVISIYTNIGVPFLSIGLGALITMFIVNPNEMELHKKIGAPLTSDEIEYMKSYGIDDGDGFISRKEYTMLIIMRIGRVNVKIVDQIRRQFQDLLIFHGEKKYLSYEHLQRYSSNSFFAMSKIFPMRSLDEIRSQSCKFDDDSLRSVDDPLGSLPKPVIITDDNATSKNSESKPSDQSAVGDSDKDDGEDEDEDDFQSEKPIPQLGEFKHRKSITTKISNESYRNLKHSTSTKKHLEKVKKLNKRTIVKKDSSIGDIFNDMKYVIIFFQSLILENHQIQVILVWILWLVAGGIFYSVKMNVSFMKGFYSSVNVGYSIYWTADESDPIEKAFSVIHLLIGQVFMSVLMAVVASNLIITKSVWYGEKQLQELWEKRRRSYSTLRLVYYYIVYFVYCYRVTLLFLVWLAVGATWSCHTIKWPVVQGIYFAITSLSMGGIWSIPENSADSSYFFVAIYTAFGAPILLLNASIMAEYIAHLGDSYLVENVVYRTVNQKEIEYMQRVGMEDGSGQLDEQEYVLLTLIRLKALPHEIVTTIIEMFNILDTNNLGNIPYADIINHQLADDNSEGKCMDMYELSLKKKDSMKFDEIGPDDNDIKSGEIDDLEGDIESNQVGADDKETPIKSDEAECKSE